jgi:RNA polymerase primary sigma factor
MPRTQIAHDNSPFVIRRAFGRPKRALTRPVDEAFTPALEPAEREPTPETAGDPPENFLALYFREMAPLAVLQPEEEFEAARRIESLEVALWTHLLSHPPMLDPVLSMVERGLENSLTDFVGLRRAARLVRGKASKTDSYRDQCGKVAKRIHALDVDRRLMLAVMSELNSIDTGEHARPPAGARAKGFAQFARESRVYFGRAQRARNEFVKSNLRLVVSIARRFNHGRMPLSDLIQEGNIGLIKAVERYDYRRGYRFSTYASWWIRHSISRALADKGRAVRLPVHMLDAYHKVTRTSRELSSKLGRPPTPEEIGMSAGMPSDKVEKIQGYLLDQSLSLDRSVSDDDDRRFIELLQDPDGLSPTEKIMEQSVNEQVQEILGDLKPIEADVLCKRFGLAGGREQTLKEIGDSYQLSRERIRQIQEQALAKIRRALQRRNVI